MTDRTVDGDKALATQKALRAELGLGEEQFPLREFIGMLSDEIEQLRDAGRSDEAIAAMISDHAGTDVSARDLADHYATSEQRGHR